ncbi:acyl-CoA thioesterase [Epilithonimonas bovis DSM 19482]|uniref:Acyl-CoA thioesterase n=1 Tax=Epilithonimonas bovis DSM 19482 TaxID=1121284 RepID=A0A1U7PUQ8_9FLAO|nr:hotdog fold thioesterase [Epilithonimonas bovis]SIT95682.1 acyl-CoA thioesterase [Epilithonimonas bovis DSM 19482]
MTARETADYIFSKDQFSQWLGIELLDIKDNYCLIKMPIKSEMINGLGTVHGGVTFAFADSALAFSSNNNGDAAVALNCFISFSKAVREGDILVAESVLLTDTRKTAVYDIIITNQDDEVVAGFRGTVYKIGKKVTEL